ncbi:hypothetical protein Fmac_006402 [Flemingia macrophylla]|uniref:Glycosyltransferase n=1 Tax=Flemingia macrophylla TaxID=520843 RepID=A0ABD1NAH5_9FABA
MAQGHIIPMMDIARLLAQRGVIVTIFTTPKNASRFASVLSRAISSGLQIRLLQLSFPSKEAGLPEGSEKYHIPRISFHGFSCFCLHCRHMVRSSKVCEGLTSKSEYFIIPGIPDQIHVTIEQMPGGVISSLTKEMKEHVEKVHDAEMKTYGVIINTFEELEKTYVRDYKKVRNGKAWCIGPVSLCNDSLDKAQRGNQASISEHHCLKWLDLHRSKSVVYVCFGSLCNLIPSQLVELALALEDTKRPFVWVIREGNKFQELEKWINEEGFEERTKGRGLIIRGWAPQVLILSHPAIGGFLTHCGWNSTLEGISAGVPMVTWPLFGDQFLNEKLVTQMLKIGVSVGVEIPMKWGEEEKVGVVVKKDDIKRAIGMVMDDDEEEKIPMKWGEEEKVGVVVKKDDIKRAIGMVMDDDEEESKEIRERAYKLSEMANRAVQKGGSSQIAMTSLIEDIIQHSRNSEETIN